MIYIKICVTYVYEQQKLHLTYTQFNIYWQMQRAYIIFQTKYYKLMSIKTKRGNEGIEFLSCLSTNIPNCMQIVYQVFNNNVYGDICLQFFFTICQYLLFDTVDNMI
jgi:hypothetical protein